MPEDWRDLDRPTRLEPRELHLWLLDLQIDERRQATYYAALAEDERARADRFLVAHARRKFVACRGQLRDILSAYLHRPAAELRFRYTGLGKPSLDGDLQFNVSHSGELAVLAVTLVGQLGADVEYHRREIHDMDGLAKRFFSPAEVERLMDLAPAARRGAFFRIWTRKEAILKATGAGLTYPLNQLTVSFAEDAPAELLSMGSGSPEETRWKLSHFEPHVDYVAAVATMETPALVRRWRWRGGGAGQMADW